MIRERTKGFVAGLLVSALVVSFGVTAMAAYQKQATLNYSDIKITMDGKAITPKDANGNVVEPFIIDGTTYLPVRGIASALGLDVQWNAATQTVALTEKADPQATSQSIGAVLMDKNGVKITFAGIVAKPDGLKGYDIKLKIENSSSTNYTVQVRDLSINGVMSHHSIFSSDVVAGKTANDAIWVYGFEEDGISDPITTAEFYFHVFKSDSWSDSFDSSVVKIK